MAKSQFFRDQIFEMRSNSSAPTEKVLSALKQISNPVEAIAKQSPNAANNKAVHVLNNLKDELFTQLSKKPEETPSSPGTPRF